MLKYNSFEIGRMEFEKSVFLSTDPKRIEISNFKKGFGGNIYPIHQGLKYLNQDILKADFSKFLNSY